MAPAAALVLDINLAGAGSFGQTSLLSESKSIIDVAGTAFFIANDGSSGRELWKSDGTAGGTARVRDILPGPAGAFPQYSVANFANVNGILFFAANDGVGGIELWKSDGTTAGTVLVKDIRPGSPSSSPVNLTNVNGTLFFTADDGVGGIELWKSNGTSDGTVLVKDINPNSANSSPGFLVCLGGTLFFTADDGSGGVELWKSDGSDAGTKMVRDINIGNGNSSPRALTNVGGTLFFVADDGASGTELWKSNGMESGTVRVKDISPGVVGSYSYSLTNVGGTLFFAAIDGSSGAELWKSDGSEAGTLRVRDIRPGSGGSSPGSLTNVGGTLFFRANDGSSGVELWKSDGSEAGTIRVRDVNPGPGYSFPNSLTNVGGVLFFAASDGSSGAELWKSDGSEAGTVRVSDINGGPGYSSPCSLANVNGTLFFAASDGNTGYELWKSDGDASGTSIVLDINRSAAGSATTSAAYAGGGINVGGVLFFTANDGIHGGELWKSNGTASGTELVRDVRPGFKGFGDLTPGSMANVDGTLYFVANDGASGTELWKSGGTAPTTALVADIAPGQGGSYARNLVNVNGILYFIADDGSAGYELWKTNGSPSGTEMVKDINSGSTGSFGFFDELVNLNGTLFFTADDGLGGVELWKTDGTAPGTALVKDIQPGPLGSSPQNLVIAGNWIYFIANDGIHGRELWKTDGTAEGTRMVRDIRSGSEGSNILLITNVKGSIFFSADDGVGGQELWKSEGTEATTAMVRDINPGSGGSIGFGSEFTNVNGTVFFVADDGAKGQELWKSDGTEATTVVVRDIFAGSLPSNPYFLTNMGGKLYFTANDGAAGRELWKSDGTENGTIMVSDINPGSPSSSISGLTNASGVLFLRADDGSHGNELWRFSNDAPTMLGPSIPSVAENAGLNALVASLTTSDPDVGDTFTYELVTGFGDADNGLFTISGNQLRAAVNLDFEAGSSRAVRIRSTDQGGLFVEKAFTITVTNVNESPTISSPSAVSFAENSVATVLTVAGSDPDAGTSLVWSLSGGADAALFGINSTTGAIKFNMAPDFEVPSDANGDNKYEVTVSLSDGSLQATRAFTISVTNVADGPSLKAPATISVVANLSTAISGLSVVDPLAGATRLTTTLSATTGKLTLGTRTGLVFLAGDGVSDATIKFTGTLAQTNAALKSATFITATDTPAASTVNVSTQRGAFVARGVVSLPLDVTGRVVRVTDPALAGKFSIVIQGTESADALLVTAIGTSTSSYTVKLNGVSTTLTGITGRIVAFGLGGDDDMDLSGARVAVRADGGEGNDGILGGRLADSLFGGNGADLIAGGLGADSINGGAGNDLVIDGSVSLSNAAKSAGKTLRSILEGLVSIPTPSPADFLSVETDLLFTADKASKDTLTGGLGTDWFWSATAGAVADVLDRSAIERRRLI